VTTPWRKGCMMSYYVAIMQPFRQGVVTTVRDTRSGAVLATVSPPAGYQFGDAVAVPGYDSFVLAAQPVSPPQSDPERLYVLQFNPATRSTTLTRLLIPAIPYPIGLTVSPDATELAAASAGPSGSDLRIYSLSGRLVRQWQGPGTICQNESTAPCPSWAGSGYLAFGWVNYNASGYAGGTTAPVTSRGANGARIIRATGASGSLLGASRLVVPFTSPAYTNLILSGDGKRIATDVLLRHGAKFYNAYEEFSVTTGLRTGQYLQTSGDAVGGVFWSNQTGSTLIIREPPSNRQLANPRAVFRLGILTEGSFTPLPTPTGPWIAFAF